MKMTRPLNIESHLVRKIKHLAQLHLVFLDDDFIDLTKFFKPCFGQRINMTDMRLVIVSGDHTSAWRVIDCLRESLPNR